MPVQPQSGIRPDISRPEQPGVLPRLLHEVRQPLCGIESIAYYLEMALEDQDDDVRHQCGKIRSMIRQASWLLDDAALGSAPPEPDPATACPNTVAFEIAARLALHDERPLDLRLPPLSSRVHLGEARLRRILEHVLCFFHDVAETAEPVRILARQEASACVLAISGQVDPARVSELSTLFESLRPGGLSAALNALGGALDVASTPGSIEVTLSLPAVADD